MQRVSTKLITVATHALKVAMHAIQPITALSVNQDIIYCPIKRSRLAYI